ncbi:hypothetical protein ACP6C7_06295 [Mycolicibacterium septicum]|uniref:Uncharacterized protein n=1 Tax=Mycolicibacterium septicum TaxID=98668 RepID=A0ABW9LQQ6_9MYCO
MPRTSGTESFGKDEAARRKRRQGSETRDMTGALRVRYDEKDLQALKDQAGKRLPTLIRQYGDLLTQLLPLADARGIDPVELIQQTAAVLLDDCEPSVQRDALPEE